MYVAGKVRGEKSTILFCDAFHDPARFITIKRKIFAANEEILCSTAGWDSLSKRIERGYMAWTKG